MKILLAILSHYTSRDNLNACLDTWVKKCDSQQLVILGDDTMPDSISNIEVYKPLENETYLDLPKKIKSSFNYLLGREWDYIVKIDDDTYLNIDKLSDYLQQNKNDQFYAGQGIHFPGKTYPCYLSNVGDKLPPDEFTYYYAHGGCYIISRSALETSIDMMRIDSYDNAEDVMVGVAMQENNILLEDRPDLFNSGYVGPGWHDMGTRENTTEEHISLINSGYIVTHKINFRQIYNIHMNISKNG